VTKSVADNSSANMSTRETSEIRAHEREGEKERKHTRLDTGDAH
jgi:hypothetical protein